MAQTTGRRDDVGDNDGIERDPAPPTHEEQQAIAAIVVRLARLDAALRAGSPSLGKQPGDGLMAALEEVIERHTMHRRVVASDAAG